MTKRLNRKSYVLSMVFALPVIVIGRIVGVAYIDGAEGEFYQNFSAFAQLVTYVLLIPVIVWTVKRLHDLNKSGWFSLLIIPPFAILLLPYLLFTPGMKDENKWGEPNKQLSFFGIRLKGLWRIISAALVGLLLLYFMLLFLTFLLDNNG